jgi:abhydrolase domain-containing protein 6
MRAKLLLSTSLVLVLLGGGAYAAVPRLFYTPLVAIHRGLSGLKEKELTADEHRIRYLEGGSGESVILLHGIFSDHGDWLEFARRLKPGYRVIAPDLRGFDGGAELPHQSLGYPQQLALLRLFVEHLGLEKFHLAGNSTGATLAAVYAAEDPERVLTLAFIGAPHGLRTERRSDFEERAENGELPLAIRSEAEYARLQDLLFVEQPQRARPIVRTAARKAAREAAARVRLWEEQQRNAPDLESRLARVQARTLTLWGAEDRVVDVSGLEVVRRALPLQHAVILPNTGHLPMVEHPVQSAALYLQFLQREP